LLPIGPLSFFFFFTKWLFKS